jgi:hypothetical protein
MKHYRAIPAQDIREHPGAIDVVMDFLSSAIWCKRCILYIAL